ncbi:MAG: hypothetical protein ACR2P0_00055 [Acidimicrobiales bacterium]
MAALFGVIAIVASACGAPKAVEAAGSPDGVHFALPTDWIEVDRQIDGTSQSVQFAPAGIDQAQLPWGPEPIVTITSGLRSDVVNFRELRAMATGGVYDPLTEDPPDDLPFTVTSYFEITEPGAWGIRISGVAEGNRVVDLLGIVNRQNEVVSLSTITCTEACYVANFEQINEIQDSWALESRS